MKALLVLLAVPVCFAQHSAPGRVTYSNSTGFGNVAHPGVGSGPQASFAARPGQGVRRAARSYAYPVYLGTGYYGAGYLGNYGGYYGDSSGYGYAPQSQPPVNVTVINAPPQVPAVIINQHFGPQDPGGDPSGPAMARTADTADSAPAQPHYFLVAFKDHSVYSALTYWIEDKTLHYVTPQQTHNQASLDLVDMDFTNKLNQH